MNEATSWADVIKARELLMKVNFDYWIHVNLFSFNWWLMVVSALITVIVWWKLIDKKRIFEVFTFALIINVISSFLDILGTQFMLWGYPLMVIPSVPSLIFVNYFALPTMYSLIYQYFPNWKTFLMSMTVAAAILAFIGEPFLVWRNIYEMYHWKYVYSFPGYILLGICIKAVVDRVGEIKSRVSS